MPARAAVVSVVPVDTSRLCEELNKIEAALSHYRSGEAESETKVIEALRYGGLAAGSGQVLLEQALRAGPLVALARVVQAQSKCIRVLLVAHEAGKPSYCYCFDLVGARPKVRLDDGYEGYLEVAIRLVTAVSAREVTDHVWEGPPIPRGLWESCQSRQALVEASRQLGARGFFARPVRISELVKVPVVDKIVAEQYSEGCFSTHDDFLGAQVVTATGSSKAIYKGDISDSDLAVVVGVRPQLRGAVVRPVEGCQKVTPSSEAVELFAIDEELPRIRLQPSSTKQISLSDASLGSNTLLDLKTSSYRLLHERARSSGEGVWVPVVRSKLHGHSAIASYDLSLVEHVVFPLPYCRYPASCGTDAQAKALIEVFSCSEALRNPDDPRPLVFTVIPGHGCVIVEKWVSGTVPLETIWTSIDSGTIRFDHASVPQGPYEYVERAGRQMLVTH